LNKFIRSIDSYMVEIPAGEVTLRDDRIKKEWQVQIKPFLLAKYTVTMEIYNAITNSTSNNDKDSNKPIVNISWNDVLFVMALYISIVTVYFARRNGFI